MKQAKPTAAESLAFLRFMQGLELIIENNEIQRPRQEPFAINNRGNDFVIVNWIVSQWQTIGPIWQRVFFAGQTCIENACDPNATTLEWRDELKEAAGRIK